MPEDRPDDERHLAHEIRALAGALLTHRTDPARVADAVELVRAARVLVESGEARPPRYGGDGSRRGRGDEVSPFRGWANVVAPPLSIRTVDIDEVGRAVEGRVRLDRLREGPPGSVHGGVLAGLFDELCGAAQRLTGRPGGVTGRLVVRYRRPTPLDTELRLLAWVTDERSRRVRVRGRCEAGGLVTAEAEAVFLRVSSWPPSASSGAGP